LWIYVASGRRQSGLLHSETTHLRRGVHQRSSTLVKCDRRRVPKFHRLPGLHLNRLTGTGIPANTKNRQDLVGTPHACPDERRGAGRAQAAAGGGAFKVTAAPAGADCVVRSKTLRHTGQRVPEQRPAGEMQHVDEPSQRAPQGIESFARRQKRHLSAWEIAAGGAAGAAGPAAGHLTYVKTKTRHGTYARRDSQNHGAGCSIKTTASYKPVCARGGALTSVPAPRRGEHCTTRIPPCRARGWNSSGGPCLTVAISLIVVMVHFRRGQ